MKKIMVVGGHPKGFKIPFDKKTRSGKILRTMIEKHALKIKIVDLWRNQYEEDNGFVRHVDFWKIIESQYTIIALGKKVLSAFKKSGIKCYYLPHPASRRGIDLKRLEIGLCKFYNEYEKPLRTKIAIARGLRNGKK